jgi:DNA-binding SARP family transcriptional activator
MTFSALHVRLLGGFDLIYRDAPIVGVNTARLQSLLAYLILHAGSPQLRRHVAFLFWPDTSEAHAHNNLRQFLHQLRQALPEHERFLTVDSKTLCWTLDEGQVIDVQRFLGALTKADVAMGRADSTAARHWLEQAVAQYQGDLLPSCYDEWITPEREQLRQQCQSAYQKLANVLEAQREYAAAVQAAQHMLRLDPADENTYILLMRLHALNYDRPGVRRTYQGAVEALRRELDVEPGEALRQAYERYVRVPETPSLSAERTAPGSTSVPLVGRQLEWQLMQAAWRRAALGAVHLVLVTGEAGIGKSRLAEELFTWAKQQGFTATHTRSYAAEGRLSFAPVIEWLRSAAVRPHVNALDNVWLREIARLLPELLSEHADLARPEPISEYGQRQRFFEALARAILAAPQPMLLWIDDLQWCDVETLEWLHFLLRFTPHARLLVLGTARSEESPPDHPVVGLARHLRAESKLTSIEVSALDAAETARLASHMQGHELPVVAAARLYLETEGNPLFVVETVHAGAARPSVAGSGETAATEQEARVLPPRVYAVIAGRLAQLSPLARNVAEVGAAIGRAFTLDLLLHAGHDNVATTVRALDELWQKRIVREQRANVFDFTHDKLREVAYAEINAPQRRLLHRHIAQAFEALNADRLDPVSAQIAAHYEQAGLFERALPYYQRAGTVAANVYANDEAITLLTHGLTLLAQLPPSQGRDTQELALLIALAALYRITEGFASANLEHAALRARELGEKIGTVAHVQTLFLLQSVHVVAARFDEVFEIETELGRLLERSSDLPCPLRKVHRVVSTMHNTGDFVQAHELFEDIIAVRDDQSIEQLRTITGANYYLMAQVVNSHALWYLGYPQQALAKWQAGARAAHEFQRPLDQAMAITYLAMLQELRADAHTFRVHAEAALAFSRDHNVAYYHAWANLLLQYARAWEQPNADNLAQVREAMHLFATNGTRLRMPYFRSLLTRVLHKAGRLDEALGILEEAFAESRQHDEHWWDAELYRLRGELIWSQVADADAAEAAFRRSLEIAQSQQARSLELRAATSLAQLWQATGRSERARELLTPVYNWFTEGFDTADLQAARSLIAEL